MSRRSGSWRSRMESPRDSEKIALKTESLASAEIAKAFEILREKIETAHSPRALLEPMIPHIVRSFLSELGNTLLGPGHWQLFVDGNLFAPYETPTGLDGSTSLGDRTGVRLDFSADARRGPDIFYGASSRLVEEATWWQRQLLRRLSEGPQRRRDDSIYEFVRPYSEHLELNFLLNLTDLSTNSTRILSGPGSLERVISSLSMRELLGDGILAAVDSILNYSFPFEQTNTHTAFKNLQSAGQEGSYFKAWSRTVGYLEEGAALWSGARDALSVDGFCGDGDYWQLPKRLDDRTLLSIVVHGGDEEAYRAFLKGFPPLCDWKRFCSQLSPPGSPGTQDPQIFRVVHGIGLLLGEMMRNSALYRAKSETEITALLTTQVRSVLSDEWDVQEDRPYGDGPAKGQLTRGKPDLVISQRGSVVDVVCEAKLIENLGEAWGQVVRYATPTCAAACIIGYQRERRERSWERFLAQLIGSARKAGVIIAPFREEDVSGKVHVAQTVLLRNADAFDPAIPVFAFLADLSGAG